MRLLSLPRCPWLVTGGEARREERQQARKDFVFFLKFVKNL